MRLINQLLEFRKMQKNKLALSLEETDIIAFCYEIFLSFKDVSESKNMDFRFEPSHTSYKMPVDKGNLDKVIYNLLSNAFKYTPSNGKIIFKVDISEQKQQLCIQVTDTGVGIPKEKRNELFNRFMQSSFSHSSVGVGLHLTHPPRRRSTTNWTICWRSAGSLTTSSFRNKRSCDRWQRDSTAAEWAALAAA